MMSLHDNIISTLDVSCDDIVVQSVDTHVDIALT